MNRRNTFNLSAMTGVVLASAAMLGLSSGAALAQSAKDIVGTWKLVSNVNTAADGKKSDAFGPHAVGLAIFGSDGYYVTQFTNPDAPKFASNNRASGTPDENKAAVLGSIGTFGTYTVADKIITMNVEGSSYPNWMGTEQKRPITAFTGDELKWSLASSVSGQNETSWKRVK